MDAEKNLQEVWVQNKSYFSAGVQGTVSMEIVDKTETGKMKKKEKKICQLICAMQPQWCDT